MIEAELVAALRAKNELQRKVTEISRRYMHPLGISGDDAMVEILGVIDGPEQREADALANAALEKVEGKK